MPAVRRRGTTAPPSGWQPAETVQDSAMLRHGVTALLAAFWLAMVLLLWRAETGRDNPSSAVPIDLVIERILHASDPSQLRLLHHGRELGQLRWVASIQERAPDPSAHDNTPEGMVRIIEGYRLDLDFTLHGDAPDQRWRILAQLEVGPDRSLREAQVRFIQRPKAWEVRLRAGQDLVEVVEEDGPSMRRVQSFQVSDIARIQASLGPMAAWLAWPLPNPAVVSGSRPQPNAGPATVPALAWTATDEPLLAGKHKVRTFRVAAKVLGQLEIVAHVSRAGELLRVTLPDQYLLASSALPGLEAPSRRRSP